MHFKKLHNMRKLKLNLMMLFLISVLFTITNCEKGSSVEENNDEIAIIDLEKQISQVKSNLGNSNVTNSKEKTYVAATFNIKTEEGKFYIENVEYLTEFEYGFGQGFSKSSSKSFMGGGIKVSCEKTGEITECPELSGIGAGMRQARCVGNAVMACLESGGCAEVFNVSAEISQ